MYNGAFFIAIKVTAILDYSLRYKSYSLKIFSYSAVNRDEKRI
jgi:hypothetical protein